VSKIFSARRKSELVDLYRAIKKLNFVLIQPVIVDEGKLIYGQESEDFNVSRRKYLIKSLLDNYLELETEDKLMDTHMEYITFCWKLLVVQFSSTFAKDINHLDYIIGNQTLSYTEQFKLKLKLLGLIIIKYLNSEHIYLQLVVRRLLLFVDQDFRLGHKFGELHFSVGIKKRWLNPPKL
jgi:hypothetical protein